MKNSKKISFFLFFFMIPIILFFILKKPFISFAIKTVVQRSGGNIQIDDLDVPLFSNYYSIKGEIETPNNHIKLNRLKRDFDPLAFLYVQKRFQFLGISGGEIRIKDLSIEKNSTHIPTINYLSIKNFDVYAPKNKLNFIKFKVEELEVHGFHEENNSPKCSSLKSTLLFDMIMINIDSKDGQTFHFKTNDFGLEIIRNLLPSYSSIIKQGFMRIESEYMSPEILTDGKFKIKLAFHDLALKDEKEINFFEKFYYQALKTKLQKLEKEGVNLETTIDKKEASKSSDLFFQEFKQKIINELFTLILK